MTPTELTQHMAQRHEEVTALCRYWHSLIPDFSPGAHQMGVWLDLHDFDRVVFAVKRTGLKFRKLDREMTLDHAVRFCSRVANDKKTQTESRVCVDSSKGQNSAAA
jgi:hypothetical protein